MAEIYSSEAEPRPATIAFIKQVARVCLPKFSDKLISRACVGAMASLALVFTACSDDDPAPRPALGTQEGKPVAAAGFSGMYILNEGGWGQNNARLDYLDFSTGTYSENLYVAANENVVLELGDVANDLQLHSGNLYAVLNGSHKVEVMNAATIKRIGQVDVNSPRAVTFSDGKGYVTSWVDGTNDNGSVVEFDLRTLQVTRTLSVGQEPEGIAAVNGKLYVACSGGMHSPNYSSELWVVDATSLTVESKITVAPNLHRVQAAADGSIWVNSRGNYADVTSGLYRVKDGQVTALNVPCAGFALGPDKVYYYASEWSNDTFSYTMAYGTIDMATLTPGASFITDGTQADITAPYGIACAGSSIFVSDAKNYASSGALYVYDAAGRRQQTFTTGVCPASLLPVR